MKTNLMFMLGIVLSARLFAAESIGPSGVYEGVGEGGPLGGALSKYTTTVTIVSSSDGTAKEVTEVWKGKDEKGNDRVETFAFTAKLDPKTRMLILEQNGKQTGEGYCHLFNVEENVQNIWCEQEMDKGNIRINKFYDAKGDKIFRMGRMLTPNGTVTFTDLLSKK